MAGEQGIIPHSTVQIVSDDGVTVAAFPKTSLGAPLVVPNVVPPGYLLYVTGSYDLDGPEDTKDVITINALSPLPGDCYKLSSAGVLLLGTLAVVAGDVVQFRWGAWTKVNNEIGARGKGKQFAMRKDGLGTTSVEGRFVEHVYVLGGILAQSETADSWDWISMSLSFPASAPEDRSGTNDGNSTKEAVAPGVNRLKPVPTNDGDWNVDGETLEVGEINLNLCPVPNGSGTGYWNWDPEATPSITPVSDPSAPNGAYDLFDVSLGTQVRQANRLPVTYEGPITPDTLKGKKLLPHWPIKFTLSRTRIVGVVACAAIMNVARKVTV